MASPDVRTAIVCAVAIAVSLSSHNAGADTQQARPALRTAPFLLSESERKLLVDYAGKGLGPINGMSVKPERGEGAVRRGLRRVITAILPAKPDTSTMAVERLSGFLTAMYVDHAQLVDGRYFIDEGFKAHESMVSGMFIVDLKTGEVALAQSLATDPALWIWEKSCISPDFEDFSHRRFEQFADRAAQIFRGSSTHLVTSVKHTECH